MHKYLLPFAQIHFVEQKIFAYKCSCCSPIVMVNISALADPQSRSPPPPPFTSFENVHLFWKCSPILKMLIRPKVFKAHHSWLLYSSFFVILDFLYFSIFHKFPQIEKQGQHSKKRSSQFKSNIFNHHLTAQWVTLSLTDSFNHWFLWQLFCNFVFYVIRSLDF